MKYLTTISPYDPEPWILMIKIYRDHGNYHHAITALDHLIKETVYLDKAGFLLQKAELYHTIGYQKQAIKYAKKALSNDASNQKARELLQEYQNYNKTK